MKLNINPPPPEPVKEEKYQKPVFPGPIGFWEVTTEGDAEGRSITRLGTHYGHVAEIALELANKCYYSLHFKPAETIPHAVVERQQRTATRPAVWIQLDIKSGIWDMARDVRVKRMREWLDANESIEVFAQDSNNASYFASVYIKLK